LQSNATALFEEEGLAADTMEKKVCEDCLTVLQKAKNVTDLRFERL
jgi:hypothetical protein